jgi:ATPase
LKFDEDDISHVIGKGGENIDRLEDELGLDITVEPRKKTMKNGVDYQVEERGNSLIINVGTGYSGEEVDVYDDEEFLFTATVGKNGEVSLTKESDLAGQILSAYETGRLDVRV